MAQEHGPSNEMMTLEYWQAVVAFGREAVSAVLRDPKWAHEHPDVAGKLAHGEDQETRNTILPGDIVLAIAGREDCAEDFYADPDGTRLYAVEREWRDRSGPESRGHVLIPNQQALLTYGAYCLFMASDRGIGYRGERDTLRGQRG